MNCEPCRLEHVNQCVFWLSMPPCCFVLTQTVRAERHFGEATALSSKFRSVLNKHSGSERREDGGGVWGADACDVQQGEGARSWKGFEETWNESNKSIHDKHGAPPRRGR